METKARPGASTSAVGLVHADKQINSLFQKHLPAMPHIFFVPTNNPYLHNIPHENLNTPFDHRETRLQYMTLISNGDRGVGASKGASDWEDEIYGKSPLSAAGHSSTSTPNPVRDLKKPSQKISFGDYKNYKQTGVKPSPRPYTATPEQKARQDAPGHSRNTSAISAITPMGRVPSSDGGDHKPLAAKVISLTSEKASAKDNERPTVPRPAHTGTNEAEKAHLTNGHPPREPIMAKDLNKDPRASAKSEHTRSIKEPLKHPLPPRPQSPPRSNPEHKKRLLESGETHPEKRVKIGHAESRTPSGSQKPAPIKSEIASEIKSSPFKSQKPSSQAAASPPPKKATSTKPIETKAHASKSSTSGSEKPLDLPPLLSPLPADLEPSPDRHSASVAMKKSDSDKNTPPKTPSKKGLGSDTIIVKQPHLKSERPTSSPILNPPKASPTPFVLPRLLSPELPDIVEEELLRLQQKSSLNTVEARHEKARLPDAPGVARKTAKTQRTGAILGHPPKKEKSESSRLPTVHEKEVKRSLIVKIPYKKRQARDIQRILQLTQKPRGQMEKLEAGERLARERSTSAAPPPKDDSESEEDVPLSKSRSTKTPIVAPPNSKKRPSDSTDRNEPAPKRSKLPENLDVAKASTPVTPAFKSPAISGPSASAQKSLLATPKKGDAMKSVAMRRVDSNDGQARTPQTTSTSTPASAEKLRPNGVEQRPNPELDKQKADEAKFYPMGTTLKRKMDSMISPKNRGPQDIISDSERKTGLCIGVESLMAYMLAFHARDRIAQLRGSLPDPGCWEGLLKVQAFLEHATRPYVELHALVEQMGALTREMLNRAYMEHLAVAKEKLLEKAGKDTRDNSRAKDAAWIGVHRNEKVLEKLGVKERGLGPWSSVQDAVALAGAVLGVYSGREKLEWSPDAHFVAAKEASSSTSK